MKRTLYPNPIIEGARSKRESLEQVSYDNTKILHSVFDGTTWTDCRFNRVLFAESSRFMSCRFVRCRFEKQHTCVGALFSDCIFKECEFRNVQFWGARFERCVFSGRLENVVFYGQEADESWRTTLSEVDFSAVQFEFVDFRCGIDLSTTRMPIAEEQTKK